MIAPDVSPYGALAPGGSTGRRDPSRRRFPTEMVCSTIAMLLLSYGIQVAALSHGGHSSLSDLPRVFVHRGVGPSALPYVDRVVEYPVGAGVLLYLAALVAPSPLGVLTVTALAAGALCLVVTVVLERRCGGRAWRWAVGTPLLLFAFQNWDVFAITAALLGLIAFEQRRHRLAGALFAVGAAVKLFPAVVVPPLVARRWVQGDRFGAGLLTATCVAVFVGLNLPFVVANPSGWWWPFSFQSRRGATWGSAWFWVYRLLDLPVHGAAGARFANLVSLVVVVGGLTWLTVRTARRHLDPVAAAAAAVTIFVIGNKVYSPTYDVWLVMFFVLLPISRRAWLAFCAVDLAVCLTVYGYFHGADSGAFVHAVLPVLVVSRTALLLWLLVRTTRAPLRSAASTGAVGVDQSGTRPPLLGAGLQLPDASPPAITCSARSPSSSLGPSNAT